MASTRPASATGDLFESPARPTSKRQRRPGQACIGVSPLAILIGVATIALLLWAVWVTRALISAPSARPAIAAVRLASIVEEYVQAQARTASPEAQVIRETRAFMARLDAELKALGRSGTTVLVAEAVLSKDVPDITDELRRAVYATQPLPVAPAGERGSNALRR